MDLTERVREGLRLNLRDATGSCVCDPAYTDRRLVDPMCGWHEAEGTTDIDSAENILSIFRDPEVVAGMAEVLHRAHGRFGPTVCGYCQEQAQALAEWIAGGGRA